MKPFDDTPDTNEFFDQLLENIELIKERQTAVPFRIMDIKRGGFLVKIEGMYGYVPFDRMPWKYPHPLCWEAIHLLLKSETFLGKVFHIEKTIDFTGEGKGFIRIFVDATENNLLTKAEINFNEDYRAVVIRKLPYGAMIDIGCHFDWKCGSVTGFLHQSKFFGSTSFRFCEIGKTLTVNCIDENEHGLLFVTGEYADFHNYVGKKALVTVHKDEEGKLAFSMEDGNNAYMPVKTSIYGEKKAWIKKAIKFLTDGEMIECEILEVKKINNLFVVKWLPNDEIENRIDLYFQKSKAYVSKIVPVTIRRSEEGELNFLVENKYIATMPIEKSIYETSENMIRYSINYWSDGEIVDCEVLDIDVLTDQFVVKLYLDNFEIFKEQEVILSCRIIDIRKGGFLVMIKGLCAFVPFDYMPWNYYQTKSWEAVAASLKGMSFYGKISRIDKTIDKTGIFRIYVDATFTPMSQVELSVNECYKGIVTLKKPYGVFVDVGYHFNWKCGSLPGLLHVSKFSDAETFQLCEPGQTIATTYLGKNEQGMCFECEGFVDLHTRFAGKTILVTISKKIDGSLSLRTEDNYKAILPVTKYIYEDKKDWILDTVKEWKEGDTIECEVLDVKSFSDVFVVKWLPENDFKKNIGKTVSVKVSKNEDGDMTFVANDRYKAEMPLTKDIYGKQLQTVTDAVTSWPDGKSLQCKVLDADFNSNLFVVQWLPNKDLVAYIGKTVRAKVCKTKADKPDFLVENKYMAEMPLKKSIYDKNHPWIEEIVMSLSDGEIIDCEVIDVDVYTEKFTIKWLSEEKIGRLPDTELPDINLKVVGKIEIEELNQRTRPKKKSNTQLNKERIERILKQNTT